MWKWYSFVLFYVIMFYYPFHYVFGNLENISKS